jgi:hypothetical protein
MKEDNKCAPTKNYSDGSCFTLEDLKKISIAFNIHLDNGKVKGSKINITDNKKKLLKQLTKNLDKCKDQICWLKQDFINEMNDKYILNTFRPDGPEGKFEWLNTLHINDVMSQYEDKYNDFKFFGAVPIDFDDLPFVGIREINYDDLYNSGTKKIGFVFNLDEHWQSGSHWVALFGDLDKNQIYFFDSYGLRPEKRIRKLVERISKWCYSKDFCKSECSELNLSDSYMNKDYKNRIESKLNVEYNHNRHQYKNSECGVYSLNFILRLLNGESFKNITENGLLDGDVNLCRDVYFKFKNNPFN